MSVQRAMETHRKAMEIADKAQFAKANGSLNGHVELLREAFELEREAAHMVANRLALEPTRSVLHRSAATIAMWCGLHREAEQLAAAGLAGNPPADIAKELRDVLQQLHFQQSLAEAGKELEAEELRLCLSGVGVGNGLVSKQAVFERADALEKLTIRTTERLMHLDFRDNGPPHARDVQPKVDFYVAAPMAGSFILAMRVGRPGREPSLPFDGADVSVGDALVEMAECLVVLNRGENEELTARIRTEAYLRNFLQLGRKLAPDGRQVSHVGLTLAHHGELTTVELTRPRREVNVLPSKSVAREVITVTGVLKFADDRQSSAGIIIVRDTAKTDHKISVPKGMMQDIVRPLWDEVVTVSGPRTQQGVIQLGDIKKNSEA